MPAELAPTDQRDIPDLSNESSEEGGGGVWGMFVVMAFVFPSNCYVSQTPAFMEMAKHLPADGQ